MRRANGLLAKNNDQLTAAHYYVYHGNPEVIRQLVANLDKELKVSLPGSRQGGTGVYIDNTIGCSYSLLCGNYVEELFKHASPVLHEELHAHAADPNSDPNLIFLLMDIIGRYDHRVLIQTGPDEFEVSPGQFTNSEMYDYEFVKAEIYAYLQIYARYQEWPRIRDRAEARLYTGPGEWRDRKVLDRAVEITLEQGPETGFRTYLDHYEPGPRSE
jgi:hypothetical protein